jgi:hypothetical protein
MNWRIRAYYGILVLVILVLLGNVAPACEPHEYEDSCDKENKNDTNAENANQGGDTSDQQRTGLENTKWFRAFILFFERLIERYPIIREILEEIFS